MSDSEMEFRIEGPEASSVADELADFLEAEFDERPRRVAPERGSRPGSDPEKVAPDTIAAGAIAILTVPAAIKHTVDLADRLALKKKLDRLVELAKKMAKDRVQIRITLVSGGGPTVRLDRATPAEIMEMAAREESEGKEGS